MKPRVIVDAKLTQRDCSLRTVATSGESMLHCTTILSNNTSAYKDFNKLFQGGPLVDGAKDILERDVMNVMYQISMRSNSFQALTFEALKYYVTYYVPIVVSFDSQIIKQYRQEVYYLGEHNAAGH